MNNPDNIALDPQLRAAQKIAAEIQEELGPPAGDIESMRRQAALARIWWNQGGPAMAEVIKAAIPGPLRPIPVVVYVPKPHRQPQPAYVFLHGGGYKLGNELTHDRQMRELAEAWGGIVVSADYAHLPEYAFPHAVEETAAVYRWLAREGAQWGIDGGRLAFGGTSAGANISLGAAIHLGGVNTGYLRAGAMNVGTWSGPNETDSMLMYGSGALYPSRAMVAASFAQYVPDPALHEDPRVKCINADPAIIPPLFLAAAQYDVFRDSSRLLAARLAAAGRPHQLKEYSGMTHVFFSYSRVVDKALECIRDMAAFLDQHVPANR
jgi:acetyl esterase